MRKSFRMFLTLALSVLGVVGMNAQERISLQEVEFYSYDGWGPDAKKLDLATPEWIMNAPSSCPYGDTNVNNGADLSAFSKMYVTVSPDNAGMRIMMNRKIQEGQCADTEEASNLISIPSHAWCTQKYCTQDGLTYIIDLAQILKDQGFVRLHAIKGASWDSQATIESIELERAAVVKQVGWTEITTNANLEGEDMSSFMAKIAPSADILPAPVVEGVGVDGTKGIQLTVPAKAAETWDSQFWIVLPQPLPEGTKYRVFFDAKANTEVTPETQAHRMPGDYIHYEMLTPNPAITTEWQSFTYEGVISATQAGSATFQSIAFNLSMLDTEIEYYFDNIRFEEYKYGVSAMYDLDVIKLDFGFDTNLPDLVKACGKPRLMYPNDCVSVKIDGEEATVLSAEGFADGRFYIFLEEEMDEESVVTLTFNNPADEAYHLVYNGGPGGDVKNFDGEVSYSTDAAMAEDAYSYLFVTPTLIAADPENGSFNLPNSISEFKLTFDKNVDAAKLVATLNGEKLAIAPAEGMAENFTLTRTSAGDLATGAYDLRITKILPEIDIFEGEMAGDTTLVYSIGKVNLDPNDTVRTLLPDHFASTGANTIPMGYTVYQGAEVREGGSSQGSGSRMFDFGAGGDFTKGLYYREGYVEYGYVEGYDLTLEAGKSYNIHFNAASWKGDTFTKFEILNEAAEVVFEELIHNNPNVNGSTAAVFSSTSYDLKFKPEATGKYFFKWGAADGSGNTGGFVEALLANVSVKYVPNAAGVEETQALLTALANAKSTRDGNVDEVYQGAAFDALAAAIAKYEAEYETYTAPSAFYNAVADLEAVAKTMQDHRGLCDTYYALPEKALEIVENNAEKKFAKTDLYAQLAEVTPKYITKKVTTEVNPETGETIEVETLDVKKLVDDAELQAAIDELQVLVNTTEQLFTEGVSAVANTGIKVLVERFRLAAESLQKLGVPADDELVVAAINALDDDDNLAEAIKNRMKLEIYGQLKNADNKLFEEKLDTNTLENYTEKYDLTVFVKNPNMYADGITYNAANQLQSGWTVPGWETPDSLGKPDISTGWSAVNFDNVDIMFQTWGGAYCVEQTIVDLPAGVYNVVGGFGERDVQGVTSYFYARTSATPEGEVGNDTINAPIIGQSFPVDNLTIPNVVVTDGMLTIGANAVSGSHTFFNQVKLYMVAAAEGFDYAGAYQEIVDGVEGTVAAPAQVLGIELYDLNGRRIMKAQQGIVILKKYMSDGTIRVEKVIKK